MTRLAIVALALCACAGVALYGEALVRTGLGWIVALLALGS